VSSRTLIACLCIAAAGAPAFPQVSAERPGREISLPPREVKDSFFAYVIGIIRAGIDVELDAEAMREVLTEFRTSLELPFDLIARVSQRRAGEPDARRLEIAFRGPVTIPIPFSLLGYHPGSIRASETVGFRETRFTYPDGRQNGADAPVFRLAVESGVLLVDVDRWLDELFGDYVDDLPVQNLVFFTWKGEWMCLLQGRGYKGQSLRAFFNFRRNRIVFPIPGELDALGRGFLTGS
jgi:hypothetical protein